MAHCTFDNCEKEGVKREIKWTQWKTNYLWYADVVLCESHQAALHGDKHCFIDWEAVSLVPPTTEVYRSPAKVSRIAFKAESI